MKALDLSSELNEAQLAAATAVDGPHLVIAGAGSGKTRTLVYRVAYLVSSGVAPESILLMTFTRRAAREMLRRATSILDERCRHVSGGTYHGFGNQVLRRWARRLGYGDKFTIIDRSDAVDLVGILRTEAGFDQKGRRFPRKDTVHDLISKEVNTGRSLEEIVEEDYPHFVDEIDDLVEIGKRYAVRKKEQNVMDYDDLLVNLRNLLVEHDDVRRKLSQMHRYVMIDEYQDTNRLQAHIGALLASEHGNIMVVGDDAQSIYSFRGADFRNIMEFPDLFPDCQKTLLEQNYRSTQPILNLGNAILKEAREKYDKKLFTWIEGGAKPALVRTADTYDQAALVCQEILRRREEGVPLKEIAVLSRAAWHTNTLEVELQNRNIPFRKFGGLRFVEAAHVKDVCALLKLSANPLDGGAWFRVLPFIEGIGNRTAQRLAAAVIAAEGSLEPLTAKPWSERRFAPELRKIRRLIEEAGVDGISMVDRLERVERDYRQWIRKRYDDWQTRMRDLEALEVLAARYDDVVQFLSDLAIEPPELTRNEGSDDQEDEWITLSTIHSAKGLEWDTVFVVHLNAGQFPPARAQTDAASLEEERRLLYVAVTRAKQNLYLLKPEQASPRSWEISELTPLLADLPNLGGLVTASRYTPPREKRPEPSAESAAAVKSRLDRIQGFFDR